MVEDLEPIPKVLDKPVSQSSLSVIYNGNLEVKNGVELTPTQVKDKPKVTWNADPNKYYLFANVDPDAPSREDPKLGPVNHWLVGNIPGNDIDSPSAEVITEYRGAGAPKGTGLHRYIFLVFEQKGKLTFDEPRTKALSRENRLNFSLTDFAKKYDLGNPLAATYYQAQWDPYVDERNRQTQ